MTARKPLTITAGVTQEMPVGDTIAPAALPIASSSDATAGTRDDVVMTPLKVAQQVGSGSGSTDLTLALSFIAG